MRLAAASLAAQVAGDAPRLVSQRPGEGGSQTGGVAGRHCLCSTLCAYLSVIRLQYIIIRHSSLNVVRFRIKMPG